jgi:phosphoenolpyruvate-protein phosphotransferase (PTS system enzyme I)
MSVQATPSCIIHGIGASPGLTMGRAFVLDRRRLRTPKLRISHAEVEQELMRMKTAIDLSDHQLQELKERLERSATRLIF